MENCQGGATSHVHSHLKACWQCRTNLEEVEKTVGACVRYRTTVLQRHLPAPPEPWTDIYRSFAEIDASLPGPSFADRLMRVLAWPVHNPKKWIPAAVAVMIVLGLFYRYRLTPSVQASELLQKAIAASDSHAGKPHLLRIRTKAASFTRRRRLRSGVNRPAPGSGGAKFTQDPVPQGQLQLGRSAERPILFRLARSASREARSGAGGAGFLPHPHGHRVRRPVGGKLAASNSGSTADGRTIRVPEFGLGGDHSSS